MSLRICNRTCARALIATLAISTPAFSSDGLHITPPPPGVQSGNPMCKGRRIFVTHMEAQICRNFYANPTPNGAIGVAHITAEVRYPLLPGVPWPQPDSYTVWKMEVIEGSEPDKGNILFTCMFSGKKVYLKRGDIQKCVQNVRSNISTPIFLRVYWGEDGTGITTF